MLRPDAKGRINLGDLAEGVSSYRVNIGENGKLTLTPYVEIPFSEKWIFESAPQSHKREVCHVIN